MALNLDSRGGGNTAKGIEFIHDNVLCNVDFGKENVLFLPMLHYSTTPLLHHSGLIYLPGQNAERSILTVSFHRTRYSLPHGFFITIYFHLKKGAEDDD